VTITGVVKKAAVNSRGEVQRVFIQTQDDVILVSRLARGKELLKLAGATVTVTGVRHEAWGDKRFSTAIDVTEYTVDDPGSRPAAREEP
jgi:hypothetical protein